MDSAPAIAIGIHLVEQVIFSIVEYRAVGVVHPVRRRGEVIARPEKITLCPGYGLLQRLGSSQDLFLHVLAQFINLDDLIGSARLPASS